MMTMLREHEEAIFFLFKRMLDYFWLFPIASSAIYGLFALRSLAADTAGLLLSISIPGSTLLPVMLSSGVDRHFVSIFFLYFPAIWILPLVSLWQVVRLLRSRRTKIGRVTIVAATALAALYPFTSFINWGLKSIESP
jgi:hypothetical protein